MEKIHKESSGAFTLEARNNMIELYKQGMSQKDIGKLYNTYNTSIRRILFANNIPLRSISDATRLVKENPFKDNCRNTDYFLGLLMTDGCIYKGSILLELQIGDISLLESYAKFIHKDLKVNTYFRRDKQIYQCTVKFNNQEAINYLQSRGNFINKSYTAEMYSKLNWDIVRGIIDGDGYLATSKGVDRIQSVGICGVSVKFLQQVKEFYESFGLHPTLRKNKNLYLLNLHRQAEIIFVFDKLYKDADIYLERKYLKYATYVRNYIEKHPKFKESFVGQS